MIHYRVRNSLPLAPFMNHTNPVLRVLTIYFNTIVAPVPMSSKWLYSLQVYRLKLGSHLHLARAYYMPPNFILLNSMNLITSSKEKKIMKLLITNFFPVSWIHHVAAKKCTKAHEMPYLLPYKTFLSLKNIPKQCHAPRPDGVGY
jgi:hypothetical protein